MDAVKTLSGHIYQKEISSNCACPEPVVASLEKREILTTLKTASQGPKISSDCACPEPSQGDISVVLESKNRDQGAIQLQVDMSDW